MGSAVTSRAAATQPQVAQLRVPRAARPAPDEARQRRTSRRAAFALLVFAGTLPLQWQAVAVTSFGVVRLFDVGAILMWVIARPTLRSLGWAWQDASTAWISVAVLLFFRGFVGACWGPSIASAAQEGAYAFLGLVAAAVLRQALAHPVGRRALAWVSPVATASFLVFFSVKLKQLGVNGIEALRQAAVNHNSAALYEALFRVDAQNTGSADYQGSQIRHEIFAALLVCMYISWLSLTVTRSIALRALVVVTSVAVLGLLAVSGSRAVILAAVIGLAPFVVRVCRRGRLSLTGFFGGLVAIVLAFLVIREIFGLLSNRVESTSSYDDRINAWHRPVSDYVARALHGGPPLLTSTHTMIGDALLVGGLGAGIAGLVLVFAFLRRTLMAFRHYLAQGGPAALAPVGAGSLILVRSFTAGGGYLHLVEWFAFALLIATTPRVTAGTQRESVALTEGISLEMPVVAQPSRSSFAAGPRGVTTSPRSTRRSPE